MRYMLRVLSSIAPLIVILPVGAQLIVQHTGEIYSLPEHLSAMLNALASLSASWIYPWLAGGVVGACLVLLVQSTTRRPDERESSIMLAWELRDLVRNIQRVVDENGAGRVPPGLESEVQSAMARLGRLGIVDPRDRTADQLTRLSMAAHFLSRLIPYLHNEQIREARRLAKQAADSREYQAEPAEPAGPLAERPRRRLLLRRRPPRPAPGGPATLTEA